MSRIIESIINKWKDVSKRFRIILIAILLFVFAFHIVYNIIFISLPITPHVDMKKNDVFITASQEKAFVQHYKNLADYYNGIVLGRYSIDEFPSMYYDSLYEIEDAADLITDKMEKAKFKISHTYWNVSIGIHYGIEDVRLKYEYREYSKQKALKEIKKIIKDGIKDNLK